ncbi:M56 family metallopeptidase [Olleya aquimaris]|uniref:Beta-lactamase regulating signal transducer with metallopeptidase domain n=1 Tax=Olleya aquimaris TaxID=639310 RepID=A0A327RM94_9FLAO|nr:M56 family metallopeptidase [Olleya aquimaris]RAJ18170.1 beta-lactamase regulating signal transducer with metallopeptidase domain [Olleya aquimaris]
MELILLKSSACLFVLLTFYKLALEPLSIHKFKRVYLLFAIAIAAVIPFITFIKYVDPTFTFPESDPNALTPPPFFVADTLIEEETSTNYMSTILWSIYGFGVVIFLVRFCINLVGIFSKIKNNNTLKNNPFVNVLIEHLQTPHTFFNFIFLNKDKFENNQIPKEVLLHEQTHAKQKHSLDILFLELVQIVFWFNPLLYWLKKEVKLNHEFLADQAVLDQGIETKTYQNILLSFSSNQQELALANAINYSSIKKRFTLMKTQTPKPIVWLRSLLLLPLLALLIYSFSNTKEVEKDVVPKMDIENNNNTSAIHFQDEKAANTNDINNKNSEEAHQSTATPKEVADYNSWAKKINSETINLGNNVKSLPIVEEKNLVKYIDIYKRMTMEQKEQSEKMPFDGIELKIDNIDFLEDQDGATKQQIAEYNALAKKYNSMSKDKMIIKSKDVERLNYLYNVMSAKQREKAEPFPNFPEPPKVPKAPKHKKLKKGEDSSIPPPPPPAPAPPPTPKVTEEDDLEQNKRLEVTRAKMEVKRAKMEAKRQEMLVKRERKIAEKEKERRLKMDERRKALENRQAELLEKGDHIPPPPPPKSPIDHVIDMAKKDAAFYYNGDAITSDKAIDLLKKNPEINISSHTNNGVSTVHLSEKPITVKNGKVVND